MRGDNFVPRPSFSSALGRSSLLQRSRWVTDSRLPVMPKRQRARLGSHPLNWPPREPSARNATMPRENAPVRVDSARSAAEHGQRAAFVIGQNRVYEC